MRFAALVAVAVAFQEAKGPQRAGGVSELYVNPNDDTYFGEMRSAERSGVSRE